MQLWIDLETTGLSPDSAEIIEVGWFVSDNWEWLTQPQFAVVTPDKTTWELLKQDLVVQTMHTQNNLVHELTYGDTLMIEDIEDQILDDLRPLQAQTPKQPVILAGSSVHFDRGFISEYMPRLDRQLSHRHLDVSTLRMFFDSLGYANLGDDMPLSNHRAQDDIVKSYELARKYVNLVNLMSELREGAENAQR